VRFGVRERAARNHRRMRWKLLLIATLVATLVGAGAPLCIVFGLPGPAHQLVEPDIFILSTLLIPVAAIAGAGFFVYRHTARRRRIQAMLTVLIATLLTLTILIFGSILLSKPAPATAPAPRRNVG
jgi:purine-cytosine permease-like protein